MSKGCCLGGDVKCSQDTYYNQSIRTNLDSSHFFSNKFETDCYNANIKCDPKIFQNSQNYFVCPKGYIFNKCVLNNPCAYAQIYPGFFQNKKYGCFWALNCGCIPINSDINDGDKAQCCSFGLPCPEGQACCPKGLCKDNNSCGDFMKEYCLKDGLKSAECDNYIRTSSNEGERTNVIQSYINNQISTNNLTLQKQPNINQIVEMCRIGPPGTCDEIMKKQCQIYSRKDINSDSNLSTLCGCFMRTSNYNDYKNLITDNSGNILTNCDPACMNAYAVQSSKNGKFVSCTSPICVIDFRNKNVQQAWAMGINLNQDCYAQGTDPSRCFIGMSKNDAQIYLKGNLKLSQKCGKCFLFDTSLDNPEAIEIDCLNPVESIAKYYDLPNPNPSNKYNIILISIGLIFVLLGLILMLFGIYKFFKK